MTSMSSKHDHCGEAQLHLWLQCIRCERTETDDPRAGWATTMVSVLDYLNVAL